MDLLGSGLQRQPSLAQTAHAEQRQQARGAEQAPDLRQLALAADERRRLERQVVRDLVDRQPPVAHPDDAMRLFAIGRRHELGARFADLEQLDGIGHPLDAPVPMGNQLVRARAEVIAGGGRQQGLTAAGERHHPGGDGLGEAFDFERLRAPRDVVGSVLAQDHRPDVQADPCRQRHRQRGQCTVVFDRVGGGVGGVVEQQQHAVRLVDLASAQGAEQRARNPVVRRPDLGHRAVAEHLRQAGAVHDIGQQQGLDHTHRAVGGRSPVYEEGLSMAASLRAAFSFSISRKPARVVKTGYDRIAATRRSHGSERKKSHALQQVTSDHQPAVRRTGAHGFAHHGAAADSLLQASPRSVDCVESSLPRRSNEPVAASLRSTSRGET